MSFIDSLRDKAGEVGNIACMGLDPVLERIPIDGKSPRTTIVEFYGNILEALQGEGVSPAIVKPNYAFYGQYGFEGLQALKELVALYRGAGIPVLLDAKRGDIGKTCMAYAREVFNFWGADAVTLSPYMGADSVKPFTDFCSEGRGVYVLTRTSNPSAGDLQDQPVDNQPLYLKTAAKIGQWAHDTPGVGSIVGATYEELASIAKFYVDLNVEVPLLIPGVGAQGGSGKEVVKVLKEAGSPLELHRINSSSSLNYAYEEKGTDDYAGASVKALLKLIKDISFKP